MGQNAWIYDDTYIIVGMRVVESHNPIRGQRRTHKLGQRVRESLQVYHRHQEETAGKATDYLLTSNTG